MFGVSALTVVLWISAGAFTGGVVTPVIFDNKKTNDWALMVLGTLVGAAGFFVFLIPLWIVLRIVLPDSTETRPAWERDALDLEEAEQVLAAPGLTLSTGDFLPVLTRNFWPKARPAGEHSHRMAYVGVFVALAIITAIEVLISIMPDPGFSVVGPLVALSTAKVLLVVMFFMHLRYDSKWYTWIFTFSMPFAALILVILALA